MIIRPMHRADIPRGLALCRDSGWNQTAADWAQLLALGGPRCIVAEVERFVVGTLTAVSYGGRFAWIGMVLVERAMRGRGIATALMNEALAALGSIPAGLDATPAGQPVYARLGFVEGSRLSRMTRPCPRGGARMTETWPRAPGIRRMNERDLDAVVAWDRDAFSAARPDLLRWALREAPELSWVAADTDGLHAYCFGRHGCQWSQVGPVIARDADTGASLVAACGDAACVPLVVDAVCGRPGWTEALASLGFTPQRPFIRMRRGDWSPPADRGDDQLAIFGPEWG